MLPPKVFNAKAAKAARDAMMSKNFSGINGAQDDAGRTALMLAIERQNLEEIQRLLKSNARVDVRDNDGNPALVYALHTHNLTVIDAILAAGGRFDVAGKNGILLMEGLIGPHLGTELLDALAARGGVFGLDGKGGQDALVRAVDAQNKDLVAYMLAHGISPNATEYSSCSPLHAAAIQENAGIMQLLLDAGADPFARDDVGDTALHACAELDFIDGIRVLTATPDVRAGLVNVKANDGATPAMVAAALGHTACVSFLIEQGAALEERDKDGKSAFYLAVEEKHVETATVLLQAGVSAAQTPPSHKNGRPVIHTVFGAHFEEMLLTLSRAGADIDARDYSGQTLLHLACEREDFEVIRAILALGADVNAVNNFGRRPLDLVLERAQYAQDVPAIVDILIKMGADVRGSRHASAHVSPPLHNAVRAGKGEIVRMLLHAGARVDEFGRYPGGGHSALHLACSYGHLDIAKDLVAAGANIDLASIDGRTPLHHATHAARSLVAAWILSLSTKSVNAVNAQGRTPLHFAAQEDDLKTMALLLQAGANPLAYDHAGHAPLHLAAAEGAVSALAMLAPEMKAQGQDMSYPTRERRETALHMAARRGVHFAVDALLELGADTTAQNKAGLVPLIHAITNDRTISVGKILSAMKAAHVRPQDIVDANGLTPLHFAAMRQDAQYCALLIAAGYDVNAKTHMGDTPLHMAAKAESRACVEQILQSPHVEICVNKNGHLPQDIAKDNGEDQMSARIEEYKDMQDALVKMKNAKKAQKGHGGNKI